MKSAVHFVMVDPNERGELGGLWEQILMDKLLDAWNVSKENG